MLTKNIKNNIIEQYENIKSKNFNKTDNEISREMNINIKNLNKILRDEGIKKSIPNRSIIKYVYDGEKFIRRSNGTYIWNSQRKEYEDIKDKLSKKNQDKLDKQNEIDKLRNSEHLLSKKLSSLQVDKKLKNITLKEDSNSILKEDFIKSSSSKNRRRNIFDKIAGGNTEFIREDSDDNNTPYNPDDFIK